VWKPRYPLFGRLGAWGGGLRHRFTPVFLFRTRSALQKKVKTKNKSERKAVNKNKETKEGRGKKQKEGKKLYCNSTQLLGWLVSPLISLCMWFVVSTDFCALSHI
jgi:hypothetical protein